jgi:hypothetical protein
VPHNASTTPGATIKKDKPAAPQAPTRQTTPVVPETIKDTVTKTMQSTLGYALNTNEAEAITANYYVPLDRLSPQMTYALSFIAMIIGISGGALLLKNPREETAWVPRPSMATAELLES